MRECNHGTDFKYRYFGYFLHSGFVGLKAQLTVLCARGGKLAAFTLTEILLALAIVGVISMIVLPQVVTKYQNNIFNHAYDRETQSISDLISQLYVDEHAGDFHNTYMYLKEEPESYDDSSGKFLKKYFRTSLYCGGDKTKCFGKKYYNYENRTKKIYDFTPKGSCALLKNGMSICISPQIGDNPITGFIDLNGKKGPNVKDRDLREFSIDPQTKTALDTTTKKIRLYCDDHPDAEVCKGGGTEPEVPDVPSYPETPDVPTYKYIYAGCNIQGEYLICYINDEDGNYPDGYFLKFSSATIGGDNIEDVQCNYEQNSEKWENIEIRQVKKKVAFCSKNSGYGYFTLVGIKTCDLYYNSTKVASDPSIKINYGNCASYDGTGTYNITCRKSLIEADGKCSIIYEIQN